MTVTYTRPESVPAELRGNPLIGDTQTYGGEDAAAGQSIERICGNCFFRDGPGNDERDCQIKGDKAKIAFDITPTEFMPGEIDGVQVGYYCPNFTDYRTE